MPTSTLSGEAERPKVADAVIEAQNRPAKAGCEAGSKMDMVPGPWAPSPVVCTPVWTRRTARPYGDRPTPSRNGVTSDRLSWVSLRAGGQPHAWSGGGISQEA